MSLHFAQQNHNKINVANMKKAGNFSNTIFYSTLTSLYTYEK